MNCYSLKVTIKAELEFELAHYNAEVKHVNNYTTGILHNIALY